MRYKKGFNDNFKWFIKNRHVFSFSGSAVTPATFNIKGVDGKQAFFVKESQGKDIPTKHPRMLESLNNTKASITLQIKQWAEGRADGTLPGIEFANSYRQMLIDEHDTVTNIPTIENEYGL